MSTPTPAVTDILAKLADVNGYVGLAVTIGEQVIPLGKWLVSEIKLLEEKKDTETYQLVLQSDDLELGAIGQLAKDDLTAINAELDRLGKPQV